MIIETVYLSPKNKDQLLKLKRATGIQNWNILCRWALCTSLSDKSQPTSKNLNNKETCAIEMAWKTFEGSNIGVYSALIINSCRKEGLPLDREALSSQFYLHLDRGLNYLCKDIKENSISILF